MALFHTTVVDNQIKALSTIGSASGAICTFDTDRAERLVNLEVAITATGGGGTPVSPIAINGFSACILSVNGTTETISFGQTVFGGRLNVGSGVLTVDKKNGLVPTANAYSQSGGHNYTYFSPSGMQTESGSKYDILSEVIQPNGQLGDYFTIYRINTLVVIGVPDSYSLTDYNAEIANTKIIYPLATPTTIQLDSKQIQAIIGTNNIYADTGDIIDLKFVMTVGKAIS